MPNTCSACPKKFTFPETGSGICQSCNEFYCSECSSIGPDRTILCNRCRVLESNEANWDSVMGLNIRDLKWFMRRRNIPSVGLIEKEQFVDAVLNSLGISTRSSNAGDYVVSVQSKCIFYFYFYTNNIGCAIETLNFFRIPFRDFKKLNTCFIGYLMP
uniref:Putative zinc finger protein n=1 Tax=Schistosoma mansoni TaxID=6183 RepID=A0A5K4EGX2_SCHMA